MELQAGSGGWSGSGLFSADCGVSALAWRVCHRLWRLRRRAFVLHLPMVTLAADSFRFLTRRPYLSCGEHDIISRMARSNQAEATKSGTIARLAPILRANWVVGCAVAILYFAISAANAFSRSPWWDEGVFADVAENFALHGHFGSRVLAANGFLDLPQVQEYTYWQFPAYLVVLGYWFRMFGTSVIAMRFLSVVFGVVLICAWFILVRKLSGNQSLALMAASLIALDYSVLAAAANGRMDMMCAALGSAALALYVSRRERGLAGALAMSGCLGCMALLTHPMGVIYSVNLAIAIVWFDAKRLRWQHLLALAAPYVAGLSFEAIYILHAPAVFASQMHSVSSYRVGGAWALLHSLWYEFADRYWFYYFTVEHGIHRAKVLQLMLVVSGIIGALTIKESPIRVGNRLLLIIGLSSFLLVGIIDNQKYPLYFIHSLVPLTAAAAYWAYSWWGGGQIRRAAVAAVVTMAVGVSITAAAIRFRQNPYREYYGPMIEAVRRNSTGGVVMGGSELGFSLGFQAPLIDDRHLGYFSGVRPEVFVVNEYYNIVMEPRKILENHVRATLDADYRLVLTNPAFRVFVRRVVGDSR